MSASQSRAQFGMHEREPRTENLREMRLAALLHDVGKALGPGDHVEAGLAALEGILTDRTRFLIAHHMDALEYRRGGLPDRVRQELRASPDFDDLMLLRDCDDGGRVAGAVVGTVDGTVDEALEYLRELARENEG
ncbi:MAG: HD domain-containing protein [Planctomycetes bacterium]|nr:HD domain-containing protein [Planctomycetota bacterium]